MKCWILLNSEFIFIIGIVSTYLRKREKRVNFGNIVVKIQQKWEREREKVRKRILNFGNMITEIIAAWTSCPSVCCVLKKETNCGNAIAENGRGKKIVVVKIWGGIKKKSVTSIIFSQHFHNKS